VSHQGENTPRSMRKIQRHFRKQEENNGVDRIFAHYGLEEEHQRQTPGGKSEREPQLSLTYWRHRDSQLAEELPSAAQRLRTAPGRPRRITKHLLATEAHQYGPLAKQLNKLPLTCAVLETLLDTPETFALRQLDWKVAQAHRRGSTLIQSRLLHRIGHALVNNSPRLQQAIESALSQRDQGQATQLTE
jgi:hypothetical protein